MTSWGTGLLAIASGAGEGMAGAVKKQAEEERQATLEEKKAAALLAREKNLARYTADLQAERDTSQNAYASKENLLSREHSSNEASLNREHSSNEASLNREYSSTEASLNREFDADQSQRKMDFTAQQTQLNADLGLRNAKSLAAYNAGLQTNSPTDIEQKYNFLAKTFGEEKAKELVGASMVKGSKGETVLDYRKLWQKTYNDRLGVLNDDIQDERSFEQKDAEAKRLADTVSGIQLSGGDSWQGNLFDKYYGTINPEQSKASTSTTSNKGLLSQGSDAPISDSRKMVNNTGFKTSMDTIAEASGLNADSKVKKAIQISKGQYNPNNRSITFFPQNDDDLKNILVNISGQGIYFDAAKNQDGSIVLKIQENKKIIK